MLAEEDSFLVVLSIEILVVVEEHLVVKQLIYFRKKTTHESGIDLDNEPLNELLSCLLEDGAAVVLHLLADIVDDVGVDLIQLAELSESTLDDELQSKQKVFCFS